jgi:hypothetical protein
MEDVRRTVIGFENGWFNLDDGRRFQLALIHYQIFHFRSASKSNQTD